MINQLLLDSAKLRHMTGLVQSKFEWIDQIQNGNMLYVDFEEDRIMLVEIDGIKGKLVGRSQVTANIWGGGFPVWPLQMTLHFIKSNDVWRISDQVASMY
ncbi:nuclear transport factor 2 family protein [Weissella cibaria]|uniref:nuclear transport factor 2 family protein n=1 Tax=Weissella cibaria TaxID=137591 RepID=UPI001C1FFA70|nr:nuclear transport factor 2 family protein [Weissella cibaria]